MVTDVTTLPSQIAEEVCVVNCGGGRVRMCARHCFSRWGDTRRHKSARESWVKNWGACCGRSKLRRRQWFRSSAKAVELLPPWFPYEPRDVLRELREALKPIEQFERAETGKARVGRCAAEERGLSELYKVPHGVERESGRAGGIRC